MPESLIRTVTVIGSKTVARADGRVAIVLDTKERGPMASEVNLQSIETLRRELALAPIGSLCMAFPAPSRPASQGWHRDGAR